MSRNIKIVSFYNYDGYKGEDISNEYLVDSTFYESLAEKVKRFTSLGYDESCLYDLSGKGYSDSDYDSLNVDYLDSPVPYEREDLIFDDLGNTYIINNKKGILNESNSKHGDVIEESSQHAVGEELSFSSSENSGNNKE